MSLGKRAQKFIFFTLFSKKILPLLSGLKKLNVNFVEKVMIHHYAKFERNIFKTEGIEAILKNLDHVAFWVLPVHYG